MAWAERGRFLMWLKFEPGTSWLTVQLTKRTINQHMTNDLHLLKVGNKFFESQNRNIYMEATNNKKRIF